MFVICSFLLQFAACATLSAFLSSFTAVRQPSAQRGTFGWRALIDAEIVGRRRVGAAHRSEIDALQLDAL
jgi:hypothetical protein